MLESNCCNHTGYAPAATTPYPASRYEDLEDAIDCVEELAIRKLDDLAKENAELKRANVALNGLGERYYNELAEARYQLEVALTYRPSPPQDPNNVTITLDREDAYILACVTGRIGGAPEGPRGAIDRVSEALKDAGVDFPCPLSESYPFSTSKTVPGSIYLVDSWR